MIHPDLDTLKIEVPFVCDQRGDCCREQPYIVVSQEEADVLSAAAHLHDQRMWFAPHDEPNFRRLLAGPCPFLTGNACSVYDIRPYNCRRFICGRPHGSDEPYVQKPSGECLNFTRRLSNLKFFRHAQAVQAEAQGWALAHGWAPR